MKENRDGDQTMAGIVIVGGGIAGIEAARTCRRLWPERAVMLLDAETEIGYFRALLPQFLTGALGEERLFFWRQPQDPGLKVLTGVRVTRLDRKRNLLVLSNGDTLPYDRLILAQGGDAYLPDILAHASCRGIFPLRDLTWAKKAKDWLEDHRRVIVFGGSLVAVKTAVYLNKAGFEVNLVVRRGHVLLRALSEAAAGLVEEHLRRLGISITINAPLVDVKIEGGDIAALKAGNNWLEGDTVLVATGIETDTSFVEDRDLLANDKIAVDSTLRTADRRIFAAGDAACIITREGARVSPSTWPQAVAQGRLAAANLYREAPYEHQDLTGVNVLDVNGLPLVVLGPPAAEAETIAQAGEGVLRELFLVKKSLAGGALIGDISAAGPLRSRLAVGGEITGHYEGLLRLTLNGAIPFSRDRRVSVV